VQLDRRRRILEIVDVVESTGIHDHRLAFHFGPKIKCIVRGDSASLKWRCADRNWRVEMSLPPELEWRLYRASHDPILGWYSAGFGELEPTFSLIGWGRPACGIKLRTCMRFRERAD
jgi:hypothetical protein